MPTQNVWLRCKAIGPITKVEGLLTIEFDDANEAKSAVRDMLKAIADALDAYECSMDKVE